MDGNHITEVLANIPDTRRLIERRPGPSPIQDLIEAYEAKLKTYKDLPTPDVEWTGKDLKEAIAKLPWSDQTELLRMFTGVARGSKDPWNYDLSNNEDKSLPIWFVKTIILTTLLLGVFGIGIFIGNSNIGAAGGSILDSLRVMEVAKILIGWR